MESSDRFDLKSALKSWEQSNLSKQELTPSDIKELKEHFLITLEEIKSKGLSEEESFAATCVRFGSKQYWGNNMQELNNSSFQLKKLVLFLGGVLFFLFCHYLVLDVHRGTLILLSNIYGNVELSLKVSAIIIDTVYLFSFLIIMISIFTRKIPFIEVIERIKPTPKMAVILLMVVLVLFVLERYLYVTLRSVIGHYYFANTFYFKERDFQIIFPFLFCIGFLIMYLKYHKKAEV
jgi:hypothetical protein